MNEIIFYLDSPFFNNPGLSKNAQKFYKIFYPASIIIFFIAGYFIIAQGKRFAQLPLFLYGVVVIILMIVQRVIFKKYGRRFVKSTNESLILKTKYFKRSISLPWKLINRIQFLGQEFLLSFQTKDKDLSEIRFKAPLDNYLEIRDFFSDAAERYRIELVK